MRYIKVHVRPDWEDPVPVDAGVAAEVVVAVVPWKHAAADPCDLPHIAGVPV